MAQLRASILSAFRLARIFLFKAKQSTVPVAVVAAFPRLLGELKLLRAPRCIVCRRVRGCEVSRRAQEDAGRAPPAG